MKKIKKNKHLKIFKNRRYKLTKKKIMIDKLYKNLCRICEAKCNQDLKKYCTIKIGGVGKYICFPKSIRQVKKLVTFLNCHKIKYYIIGNGSNIVFEDTGYRGVLISLKNLKKIYANNTKLFAYAGANLFSLNNFCSKNSLCGLEFSYGIPASVGGAVFMNAGAFGKEMSDVIECVWVLLDGRVKKLFKNQLGFGYRHSEFMKNGKYNNAVILKACFKLKKGVNQEIQLLQKQIFAKRMQAQPYGTLNCGSVFKKVQNDGAGKIIDKMGLKGVTIGDIQISPKHANFFVNLKRATSADLHQTINKVKEQALEDLGINLPEEIIFVGD